jgi:hypothetical protein
MTDDSDTDYLMYWAKQLKVNDLLELAIKAAALP